MTRRVTLAIVGAVVATLVVAGLGTLVLARFGSRQSVRGDLEEQAGSIAAVLTAEAPPFEEPLLARRQQLANLVRAFRLQGIGFVVLDANGQPISTEVDGPLIELPDGVELEDLDTTRLLAGETLSGFRGDIVFAAAPARRGLVTVIVIATREASVPLGPAVRWFLLAAAITVLIAVLVGGRLGRRLTEPVRSVEAATRRLAAGDLAARVSEPPLADTDELATLARSVNAMAATLERSRGLERQFLLSVSHDLRTPLTSIQGYAEAIADGTAPDPAAASTVILGEARRLDRLVRDLLDLARLDARRFSLDMRLVDLVDVAAGTVDGFRPEAQDAGITLAVDAPATPVTVAADADRLAQVVANLLENALKFAATRVAVTVAALDGTAVLAVNDDGPGIPAEDLPYVFERLYVAAREPRRKETGSGLGLAIVRELVTAMGGTVAAEPSTNGGARLVLRLPLATP